MAEEHKAPYAPPTWPNRVLLVVALVAIGILVPWLLQDPNYRDLARVPLAIESTEGITIRKSHGLISRQAGRDGAAARYLVQFTFEVTNTRGSRVPGLRLRLSGIGKQGDNLFTVRSKPPVLELEPGASAKAFVRVKDLPPATIEQLSGMTVTSWVGPPAVGR
jgi:hypothetical protein